MHPTDTCGSAGTDWGTHPKTKSVTTIEFPQLGPITQNSPFASLSPNLFHFHDSGEEPTCNLLSILHLPRSWNLRSQIKSSWSPLGHDLISKGCFKYLHHIVITARPPASLEIDHHLTNGSMDSEYQPSRSTVLGSGEFWQDSDLVSSESSSLRKLWAHKNQGSYPLLHHPIIS